MRTRLQFADNAQGAPAPDRCDAALLVGAVTRRRDANGVPTPLPHGLENGLETWWTQTMGWRPSERRSGSGTGGNAALPRQDRLHLLNLPVPIESLAQFDALFVADRPVAVGAHERELRVPCALAAAVRAFFACGGRRCFVVRTGDAWAYPLAGTAGAAAALAERPAGSLRWRSAARPASSSATPAEPGSAEASEPHAQRAAARVQPLPGLRLSGQRLVSVESRFPSHWAQWQGVHWALGLPEVSMLLLPDLAEACAVPGALPVEDIRVGVPLETFGPCVPDAASVADTRLRQLSAPALDGVGSEAWRAALAHALAVLRGANAVENRRDVQLIASLPLPLDRLGQRLDGHARPATAVAVQDALAPWLLPPGGLDGDDADAGDLRHSQLQLTWPWLIGARGSDLPQGLEAPEGAFAGSLAASTLQRGIHRSMALQAVPGVTAIWPRWTSLEAGTALALPGEPRPTLAEDWLCLCLPGGHRSSARHIWHSDRTTAQDPLMRIGAVRRLLAQVQRHARRVGDAFVHEPSVEATWRRLRSALDGLGERLVRVGALDDSVARPWEVICDRRSMSQADLDAGRLIAIISFQAALPIERIRVTLTLREGSTLGQGARLEVLT